jgi:putative endonuclease
MNTTILGKEGELLAIEMLRKNKFAIVATNFRFKKWEIDIIAKKDNLIVFVEVKTRSNNCLFEPWKAVSLSKQQQIIKVANDFLIRNQVDGESRFDIISILKNKESIKIDHIQDAFSPLLK